MQKFLDFLKGVLSSVDHAFHSFIDQAIPVVKKAILNDILPIAETIVKDLVSADLTGDQKKAAAFDGINNALKDLQKDVVPSLINLAIEIAYQKVTNVDEPAAAAEQTTGNGGNLPAGEQGPEPAPAV